MKTINEWLNELEEPYRTQAINNSFYNINKTEKAKSLSFALSMAFIWDKTNEGHDYWEKLNDKLKK